MKMQWLLHTLSTHPSPHSFQALWSKGSMTLAASPLPLVFIFTMRTSRTETEQNTGNWGDLCWGVDYGTAQGWFILCDSSPWQDYRKSGSCWGANMYPLHWNVGRWWLNGFCHKALTNYQELGVFRVLVPVLRILTEIFCKCGFFSLAQNCFPGEE